jgi:hypothetical protein
MMAIVFASLAQEVAAWILDSLLEQVKKELHENGIEVVVLTRGHGAIGVGGTVPPDELAAVLREAASKHEKHGTVIA